jgi:hypothetical protein
MPFVTKSYKLAERKIQLPIKKSKHKKTLDFSIARLEVEGVPQIPRENDDFQPRSLESVIARHSHIKNFDLHI